MLPNVTFSRPMAILFLAGTFCLVMICSAQGQQAAAPPEAPQPDSTSPAATDTTEPPAAKAEPGVTLPDQGAQSLIRPIEPAAEPDEEFDLDRMLAFRSPIVRLASVPNMFGDSFTAGGQLQLCDFAGCRVVDIPPPGGGRHVKVSENDKALPMDRVFFTYNHFQNALDTNIPGVGSRSLPLDRYTIGLEKMFCDDLWSVELRMPFSGSPAFAGPDLFVGRADVGNLSITLKRLLYSSESTAVAAGLPIHTPTGGDVTGQGSASSFTLFNDAVHLAPFVGFLSAPNDRLFYEGFLQVDVAANGNRVVFGGSNLGSLSEQTLLYVDLAIGYWLFRNPHSRCITGLAPVVEYHYTTTLQDASLVSGTDGNQVLEFGNMYNRMDISNLTVGLHTELGMTDVRAAAVLPLSEGSNRWFDAEVQVSVNRRF